MSEYVDIAEPTMIQFLAEKMVDAGEDNLFGAMFKIMLGIIWTNDKKFASMRLDPVPPPHADIASRSISVGLLPPRATELGAWTHMILSAGVDARTFADLEQVIYFRHALNKRTIWDDC